MRDDLHPLRRMAVVDARVRNDGNQAPHAA